MTIGHFRASGFRCLEAIDAELAPDFNLITGENASGKTSFLEALAYLGRGKSFRGAPVTALVQHGQKDFTLFGKVASRDRTVAVGVQNGSAGFVARVDGETGCTAGDLATLLPLQVIDPDVHDLVAGGPEQRRRFLDWIAFHVEPSYLGIWRRFRRALRQRNASLKSNGPGLVLDSFDREFVSVALEVDTIRRQSLAAVSDSLSRFADRLLDAPVSFEYSQGWGESLPLMDALAAQHDRDRQLGSTQSGPHRADLKLRVDERVAKRLVSRGQQKLLACAMVLASTEVAQASLEAPVLLLLDDPAAELDRRSLARLLDACFGLSAQLVVTSLDGAGLDFPSAPHRFHVEHGRLTRLER